MKPVWLVKPSDKRRKDEDIAEAMLGKIITAEEATFNRAPKLKPPKTGGSSGTDGGGRGSSPSSSNSHGGSPTNLSDDSNSNAGNKGKRKHDELDGNNNSGSDRANNKTEQRKTVTFSQEEVSKSTTSGSKKSKTIHHDNKEDSSKVAGEGLRRVGTRSSGDAEILPELPSKRKIGIKRVMKVKKDDNVTIVKMLTGTLYMYRGDRPRAEFVRFK